MKSLQFSNTRAFTLSGELSYVHGGAENSICAFEGNEKAYIRIRLPRILGVISIYAYIYDEACTRTLGCNSGRWIDSDGQFDIYEIPTEIQRIGVGLYYFSVEIISQLGKLYLLRDDDRVAFSADKSAAYRFQISLSDFKHSRCNKRLGGIIYHIFVDRFFRAGVVPVKEGAIVDDDWRIIPEYPEYPGAPLKNNHFYGGTLWGIIEKLEYIKSLGVNIIYLSPIFDAASNHKYDTADYMSVDVMFGAEEALVALIEKCKSLDISIVLDGVFNHTGADSIYFNKYGRYDSVGAYQSKDSQYYSWYDFKSYPDKYTSWWDIDILPRINPDIPECGDYFVADGGVIEKYARIGVDGFRLDVVDELSDAFVTRIKDKLSSVNPTSVLYGEVWEDASNKIAYNKRKQYYLGAELDGVMNYPLRQGIIDYLTTANSSSLKYALTDIINNAPKRITDMQMNLLGTHDTARILTLLGGETDEGRSNDYLARKKMNDLERGTAKRRLRMAYAMLATLPGLPTIFYGDEAGVEGYKDPFNRMPYPWGHEDKKLISYYTRIGAIRRDNEIYREGDFKLLYIDNELLLYSRYDSQYSFVTAVNNSPQDRTLEFSVSPTSLIESAERISSASFSIPAYTAEIFKVEIGTELTF